MPESIDPPAALGCGVGAPYILRTTRCQASSNRRRTTSRVLRRYPSVRLRIRVTSGTRYPCLIAGIQIKSPRSRAIPSTPSRLRVIRYSARRSGLTVAGTTRTSSSRKSPIRWSSSAITLRAGQRRRSGLRSGRQEEGVMVLHPEILGDRSAGKSAVVQSPA